MDDRFEKQIKPAGGAIELGQEIANQELKIKRVNDTENEAFWRMDQSLKKPEYVLNMHIKHKSSEADRIMRDMLPMVTSMKYFYHGALKVRTLYQFDYAELMKLYEFRYFCQGSDLFIIRYEELGKKNGRLDYKHIGTLLAPLMYLCRIDRADSTEPNQMELTFAISGLYESDKITEVGEKILSKYLDVCYETLIPG